MRRIVWALVLAGMASACASAQTAIFDCYNGSSQQGGNRITTNGIQSSQYVQQSYPGTTVTVFNHNTVTPSTIFRDEAGTQSLSNPFTSSSHSVAFFCAADGRYDVQYSGTTITAPFSVSDIKLCFSCAGGGGGGGGSGTVGPGTTNQSAKFLTPTSVGNGSLFDDGLGMVMSPNGVTVVGNAYGLQYPNSTNGSTNNLLACIDPAVVTSSQVTTCPTSTIKAIGIVHGGAGTTGNAQVSQAGFENCVFDNQTIIGDAVVPSTTVAGQCDDAGAVRPPATQGIGRVVTVNSGAGTAASVQIFSLDISAPGASGGSGTVANCGSGNVNAYYGAAGTVVSCDTAATDDGSGNMTMHSLGTTDNTKAGFMYMKQGTDAGIGPVNTVQVEAPAAVTAYEMVLPGTAGNGCISGSNAAGIVTLSFAACAGSSYPVQVNGGAMTANDTLNFNGTTPAAGANGINVTWQTSRAATTDSISAEIVGDGNAAHFLNGTGGYTTPAGTGVTSVSGTSPVASSGGTTPAISINNNGITATQLAAQYSKLRCETGLGDGLNAMTAGTYLQYMCVNKSGVTWTITGIFCFTDNAGTSTLNATNNAGTGLLTGAVTCNSTKTGGGASGSQSATTTLANDDAINFTFVADGTSKQTTWTVTFTQ